MVAARSLKPLPHAVKRREEKREEVDESGTIRVSASAPRADPEWGITYQEMLKQSICLFGADVLGVEMGPHLFAWEALILRHQNVSINAARDHSKSTFFSYIYPIWRAWSEPGCEVYVFSKTLEQAIEFLDIMVDGRNNLKGLDGTPALRHLLPRDKQGNVRRKKTDIRLTNGSRIRAIGYGKAIRGAHPKYIVCDDVLNDEDMWSETQRMKHIEYFKSAIVNMAPKDGQICVVGTPYHVSDLYGFLRKNEGFVFRRYPGILKDPKTGNERPLFPYRWSLSQLYQKKKIIGPVSFAREILCEPITDDLAIFPSYLFPPLFDDRLVLRPTRSEIRVRGWTTYMGVDIARSASVGADYFVIFCIAKDNEGNHYVVDIHRSKGLPFIAQLEQIKLFYQMYDPALVFIESNQMQQVWSDEMRRTTDIPIKEFVTTAQNKYPLDKGLPSLRILLENRKLVIPRGDAYSRATTDIWINEATQFGFIDGKLQGIGEHDDTVMAWWIAEEAAKAGGFSFGFGDEDDAAAEAEFAGEGIDWEKEMLGDDEDFDPNEGL